jgi:hypothetical protein
VEVAAEARTSTTDSPPGVLVPPAVGLDKGLAGERIEAVGLLPQFEDRDTPRTGAS